MNRQCIKSSRLFNVMPHDLSLSCSYEFKVKPKNELGEGPPSEPVSFSTESGNAFKLSKLETL